MARRRNDGWRVRCMLIFFGLIVLGTLYMFATVMSSNDTLTVEEYTHDHDHDDDDDDDRRRSVDDAFDPRAKLQPTLRSGKAKKPPPPSRRPRRPRVDELGAIGNDTSDSLGAGERAESDADSDASQQQLDGGDPSATPPEVHAPTTRVRRIAPANGKELPFPYYDKNLRAKITPSSMWKPSAAGDATGVIFDTDPRKYRICHFTHACLNLTHTIFPIADREMREKLDKDRAICTKRIASKDKPKFCMCFMTGNLPAFVDKSEVAAMKTSPGHVWLLDTYVNGHQIGHFAETHGLFHSISLQAASYSYPQITRMLYNRMERGMSDHEKYIYELAISSLGYPLKEPICKNDISHSPGHGVCMDHLSATSITAIIATSQQDASAIRAAAYRRLQHSLYSCPPSQVLFLYRNRPPERRVLNQDAIIKMMREKYKLKDIKVDYINGGNTSFEQVKVFAESGLIIASHSSQLINLMFTQPHASVIELVPAYFNNDFVQMGKLMEMHYQLVISGHSNEMEPTERVKECNTILQESCAGKSADCVMDKIWALEDRCVRAPDAEYDAYAKKVKPFDFYADMAMVETAIGAAIYNLHKACGGQWPGSDWTTPFSALKGLIKFKSEIGNGFEG